METAERMTDIEMTRCAAKALGYEIYDNAKLNLVGDEFNDVHVRRPGHLPLPHTWKPLMNLDQAFVLVNELHLNIQGRPGDWSVYSGFYESHRYADLKRAIVECAVQMQMERQ